MHVTSVRSKHGVLNQVVQHCIEDGEDSGEPKSQWKYRIDGQRQLNEERNAARLLSEGVSGVAGVVDHTPLSPTGGDDKEKRRSGGQRYPSVVCNQPVWRLTVGGTYAIS